MRPLKPPVTFLSSLTVLALLLLTGCSVRAQPEKNLHLVIDAGSSGTRFCLYHMRYSSAQQNSCTVDDGSCRSISAPDGLAGLSSDQIRETLQNGFQSLSTEEKNRIVHVSLLGTGGFRRLDARRQKTALEAAAESIFATGFPATIRVISGEEEAVLAWRTIRAETGSQTHGIVETGGATVQVADGRNGNVLRKYSFPLGMNDLKKRLHPHSPCFSEPAADRFHGCRSELLTLLDQLKRARGEINQDAGIEYYGLGNPFMAIFKQTGRDIVTDRELEDTGSELCQAGAEELLKRNIPASYHSMTCYLYAFHSAELQLLSVRTIRRGSGSWPTGAAVSPEYFPGCR